MQGHAQVLSLGISKVAERHPNNKDIAMKKNRAYFGEDNEGVVAQFKGEVMALERAMAGNCR